MTREEIKEHILTQISYGFVDYGIHDEETLNYIKEVVSNYDKIAKDYKELKEIHYSIQGGRFSGKTYILHLQKKIKELEKGIEIKEYNRNTLYTAVTEIAKTLRIEDYEIWNFDLILDKIEKLQKQAMLGKSYKKLYGSLKKQKNDVIELIKTRIKENEGHINARMEIYHYKNMLRMLGEIDEIR